MSTKSDIQRMVSRFGKAGKLAREAAKKALAIAAEQTIGDAQQLCPVDTGALAASGTVGEARAVPYLKITLGFNTRYAAAVHENVGANFKDGKEAKFLETSVRNMREKLPEFVAEEVRKVL